MTMTLENTIPLDTEILEKAATQARGLAIDAVSQCNSGHLGLPLGAAEIGAVLFSYALQFNPEDPLWLGRDRFVLSAGHGSMFLYTWLHLTGYDLSQQDIKNFRKLHSKTPGHPEFTETPGVESTTGPLGQGIGNAVGMACASRFAAHKFNTSEHTIIDQQIICLCGDGCLQEGVALESIAFAGKQGLDNLTLIYDSNDVTLDAMADKTQVDDVAARFKSSGWDVQTIDGHDYTAIYTSLTQAKYTKNKKPKIIIAKTEIGRGIPEVAGTPKAHGESGAKFAKESRKNLGLPEEKFYVSDDVKAFFESRKAERSKQYNNWQSTYTAWQSANPALAKELENAQKHEYGTPLFDKIPEFDTSKNLATRAAGGKVINDLAQEIPMLVSGSADLHGSTKNYIDNAGDMDAQNPTGRNIYFGIREHAMGAIVNGFGYYGLFCPSGATFLTFSDYMRPSIRLAALSKLPIFHIFTHDSVGVGEDGPTHQPVEHVSALRLIPNLDVIRPADPEETAGAFVAALERKDGPTALSLTRQGVAHLSDIPAKTRREGVLKGAYIAKKESGELDGIIIATGSELQHALEAAKTLGNGVRVVSMPCCERFDRQEESYKEDILPKSCTKRIAIEAGVTDSWFKYTGTLGKTLGIDKFGYSAPGSEVMSHVGMTAEALLEAYRSL